MALDRDEHEAKEQPPMIVESGTVTTVAEMLEFCLAAIAKTGVEPATILLRVPQDMHVDEITLSDSSKAYDLLISPAA
jgi:hypothetical protein